ncbi:MAG: hypothetical protein Q8K70_08005 [Bacteroidota bacterium]|nr:hypothetical protein [Bacteroidota bacterium]
MNFIFKSFLFDDVKSFLLIISLCFVLAPNAEAQCKTSFLIGYGNAFSKPFINKQQYHFKTDVYREMFFNAQIKYKPFSLLYTNKFVGLSQQNESIDYTYHSNNAISSASYFNELIYNRSHQLSFAYQFYQHPNLTTYAILGYERMKTNFEYNNYVELNDSNGNRLFGTNKSNPTSFYNVYHLLNTGVNFELNLYQSIFYLNNSIVYYFPLNSNFRQNWNGIQRISYELSLHVNLSKVFQTLVEL